MVDLVLMGLGSFDSDFNYRVINATTNAELRISLNVFLRERAPGPVQDSNSTNFTAIAWDAKKWAAWTKSFQKQAQAYWHGKFWLKTPASCDLINFTPGSGIGKYRCNVWCRFELKLAASAAGAHKIIDVANLQPTPGMNSGTFRSNDSLYDNYDLGYGAYIRDKKVYYQRTFIHEVGHAIGLPHIGVLDSNATCTAAPNTNADVCYGTNATERKDIMGMGEHLSDREARPWLTRLAEHLELANTNDWKAHRNRVYPVKI